MLTDVQCRNAKPRATAYKLSDSHGLFLYITPKGQKYWRYRYRFANKEKLIAYGVYPEVSLNEAREKQYNARKMLREGTDPGLERKRAKAAAMVSQATTFEMVALEWHEHFKGQWCERHAENIMARLKNHIFPAIGKLPIAEIRPPLIRALVREVEDTGALDVARRTLQCCSQVFTYALATDRVEINPALGLNKLLKPITRSHFSALTYKELPEFLERLHSPDVHLRPITRLATEMLMLTFVRTSELVMAKWSEIDFTERLWIIPAPRMKKRRDHIVALSDQAISILERAKVLSYGSEWVFPSFSRPREHMSTGTILGAIKRIGYRGRMTGHGFRSLAMSTIKERLGYRHEVIDRQLAHKPTKLDQAYDRAEYLDERRKMMQDWADFVATLSNPNKGAKHV